MRKQCKNCGKALSSGKLDFCSKACMEEYKNQKSSSPEAKAGESRGNPQIEEILAYVGITQDNTAKKIAYQHWYRFVDLALRMKGKKWQTIRSRMRSYVNVDFRYIDDYKKCLESWGIFSINNGVLVFKGIPDENSQ